MGEESRRDRVGRTTAEQSGELDEGTTPRYAAEGKEGDEVKEEEPKQGKYSQIFI